MNEMKFRLDEILENMEVPEEKKNLNFTSNIIWLLRNLGVYNRESESYNEALSILKRLNKKIV